MNRWKDWQSRLYIIIFEADTPAGKWFDLVLICSIIASVLAVMLDSIGSINRSYGSMLYISEWFFTLLFTLEYMLRLFCSVKPLRYATSFFGIVDLLAILPTYVSMLIPGSQFLISIRILRILRVFRVLKLAEYSLEAQALLQALKASYRKITVFIFTVLTLVVISGSLMYLIEGEEHGFTSIPVSVYWAIVTMTTVGYGDISPHTNMGKMLAAVIMILGYGIIAVPTGIVTVELSNVTKRSRRNLVCRQCRSEDHSHDAKYCKECGTKLRAPL